MKELSKKKIISLTRIIPPFLMVDNIKNIISLKSSSGIKKVNKNSWFFKCHFTNQPMMPGVLLEEAMLQTIVATLYSSSKFKDIITLDMGGTSTDVCLIQNGKAELSNLRDISGFRIRLPMIDINTVGAGGGSIAYVESGVIEVGVVYNPFTNELFAARRGQGATLNGLDISPSEQKELSRALIATGFPYEKTNGP